MRQRELFDRGLAQPPWQPGLAVVVLAAAVVTIYAPSLAAPFTFDDIHSIVTNGRIRHLWGHDGGRSVVDFSFAVNYRLGRNDPRGYRAVNIAIHIAAALTLYGITRRTLRLPGIPSIFAAQAEWIALEIALLWALHPLQTQSVTYIVQRYESMMGLFYLLTLYGLLRGADSTHPWRGYALAVISMMFGVHCKEPIVTAPLVLLLFDRAFLSASWREIFRQRWDVYVGLLIVSRRFYFQLWTLFTAPQVVSDAGFHVDSVTPAEYLRTQPEVVLHYLRLAAWPDVLCLDYRWPIQTNWGVILLTISLVVGLIALSIIAYWRWPKIGWLGLTFFILLSPTSLIPIRDLAVEHRMYLPLAPLVALAVIAWHRTGAQWFTRRRLGWAAHIMLLLAAALLAMRTASRNADYVDPVGLWRKVLEVAPHNDRAHDNIEREIERDW